MASRSPGAIHRLIFQTLIVLAALSVSGCTILVERLSSGFTGNLSQAMINHDDPDTVRDGLPAYLLLVDGLIRQHPESVSLLLSGARLYSAYAGSFVENKMRAKTLADRGVDYADRALCQFDTGLCAAAKSKNLKKLMAALQKSQQADIEVLYTYGVAKAAWIESNVDDWNAIADLPSVEAILTRVEALQAGYDNGAIYIYLGVLNCLLPPAYGGKPELGQTFFLKAIEASDGRNLYAKVLYARHYARLMFDKALHDRLLNEVMQASARAQGFTLSNVLAKKLAAELLESGDEYF